MNFDMPKFREKQIEDLIEEATPKISTQIRTAYRYGASDGESHERRRLIARLREYEKDSIVAKLIAEMLEREDSQ